MIQLMTGIDSSASALAAERVRMDVISQNIANANTSHGLDGKPYQRQQVVFEAVLKNAQANGSGSSTLSIPRIEKDNRPPRLIFQPNSPEADANGMVAYPDISIPEEMADMIVASRAFEANLAVVKNARAMTMQTLSIGKR
jgi:flagellar basal-body rod protein FlgC